MFECVGWCILNHVEIDEETTHQHSDRVRRVADEIILKWDGIFTDLYTKWVNGHCFLIFFNARNHGGTMHEPITGLAKFITEQAPRSYGVFHVRDSELPGHENVFKVIKIAGPEIIVDTDATLAAVDIMDNLN